MSDLTDFRLAHMVDDEELTDCPRCGVNGYAHKPDCRVPRYLRDYNEAMVDQWNRERVARWLFDFSMRRDNRSTEWADDLAVPPIKDETFRRLWLEAADELLTLLSAPAEKTDGTS